MAEVATAPAPVDGAIKTITEERTDEQGRLVRITRKICIRRVTEIVKPKVAHRRSWKKYGDAASDGPGPNLSTTILGEPVFLKLSVDKDAGSLEPAKASTSEPKSIICRYCQGAHWTVKCPHKDTFVTAEGGAARADTGIAGGQPSSKYIPPSLRAKTAEGVETNERITMPVDNSTVRITNLADITTEQDVRELCGMMGPIRRAYVSRDLDGLCRGFAFVTYESVVDAVRAVKALNGHRYGNLIIKVEQAKPAAPPS